MKQGALTQLFIILLVFFSLSVSAQVVINEFVVDPQTDWNNNSVISVTDEWIEILNSGVSAVNLSGWTLNLTDGTNATYTFSETINPNQYLVILNPPDQQNIDGQLLLIDNSGVLIDSVSYGNWNDGNTSDNAPTGNANSLSNECLARIPDGSDTNLDSSDFVQTTCTFAQSNVAPPVNTTFIPITISPSTLSPLCIIEFQNVTISAFINGSIESIIFAKNTNGVWQNISLSGTSPGNYQHKIFSSEMSPGSDIEWQFIVQDTQGTWNFGALESAQVNSKTTLETSPLSPDGLNSWFVTQPTITLENPDAANIFYKWDSQSTVAYNAPFSLEGAPNNANIHGGILELNYWSDVCASQNGENETSQRQILKADFTNPLITNFNPQNSSTIYTQNPTISAYIDEIYGSNSGINLSSVQFSLDGTPRSPNKTSVGIDASVSYTASNLSFGPHTVEVSATDNAGRSSTASWFFTLSGLSDFLVTINSPENKTYETRRVPVNISMTREAREVSYINHNNGDAGFRRLCRDCDNYGESTLRKITMVEGENHITFRALGPLGEVSEQEIIFLVDSKIPKISKTLPKKGFSSGIFEVVFIEENPSSLLLFIENQTSLKNLTLNLSSCNFTNDGKRVCSLGVDLSEFEGGEIEYYFKLNDVLGNSVSSKRVELAVDTTPPEVTSFGYLALPNRRINFVIGVEDANFDEIVYIDHSVLNPRERKICSRLDENNICNKKISFSQGLHVLDIFAFDKAGNGVTIAEGLEFFAQ